MRKLMVEFFSKFESRGIKFARVNSTRIAKNTNFLQLLLLLLKKIGNARPGEGD